MDLSLGHEDVLSLLRIFAVDGPAQLEKLKEEVAAEADAAAARDAEEARPAEAAVAKCAALSAKSSHTPAAAALITQTQAMATFAVDQGMRNSLTRCTEYIKRS